MSELDCFIERIQNICGQDTAELDLTQARQVIKEINEFLYTNYDGIGTISELGMELNYFSDFHKYWHEHHREIIDLQISDNACEKVADALHDVYVRTGGRAFSEVYDTNNLSVEDICRIRFLTANQDFRGSRNFAELSEIFLSDPSIFDERCIAEAPADFVKSIGMTSLSQNDKRLQFAKRISHFLLEHNSSPYNIIDCFDRNVSEFRQALIQYDGAGYGNKKADMFIRDMVVLGVWESITGFDRIDVASDINTIKVALRTGILTSAIPLVSSFIDIFGYQYGYVDEANAAAWRKVWEIWEDRYPNETISSPCLLDYFIYNVVGRQFCKEILCIFECELGHRFKWHNPRNRTCQICYANDNRRERARLIGKIIPCNDTDGNIAIRETNFYRSGIANPGFEQCPFQTICDEYGMKQLLPPKSISITGQTGWTTAYTDKDAGGGGLMA